MITWEIPLFEALR